MQFNLPSPFRTWPAQWHAIVGGALIVTVALSGWLVVRATQRSLDDETTAVAAARAETVRMMQSNVQPSAPHSIKLAAPQDIQDVTRDIGNFAQRIGAQVSNAQFEALQTGDGRPARYPFKVLVTGTYKDSKFWIGDLLARYPSLELQALTMRASPTGNMQVETNLSFVLYVHS